MRLTGRSRSTCKATPTEALPELSGEPDPEALLASRSSGGFPDPIHD